MAVFKRKLAIVKATVGPNTAIIKKAAKSSSSGDSFETVLSRKKRKGGVLEDSSSSKKVAFKVQESHSWGSETGNTTESESIDMKKECLVEETSFDFGKGGALAGGDHDQTPMSSKVKTKKALGKPLGKIDFSKDSDGNSILSDAPLELPPPLKNLVNVSVRKSFALDIGLDKLVVVRKLFSEINGFGEASTPSKFSGIIRATFTSESSLMKATDKAVSVKILVNTNLKKSFGQSDWAVVIKEILIGTSAEAVCTALSEFGVIKVIKMQLIGLWQKTMADLVTAKWSILIKKDAIHVARADSDKKAWDARDQHRALLYTLLMETNAYDIWDFVRSVGGKTCIIDRHSVMYAWARCAVVCFDSAESLNAAVGTMPVLRNTNLCWSRLISAKCAKCKKLDHTSLGCVVGGKFSSGNLLHRVFLDTDKSRLAIIYAKCSALVAHLVFFGGLSWTKVACGSSLLSLSSQNVLVNNGSSLEIKPPLPVMMEVDNRFAILECSLTSLVKQVSKLAIRLNALGPMVLQPSPGCQPLGSGASTGGGNVVKAVSFNMSLVSKLEDSMKCLMETVLGLLAKVDSIVATCNIRGMNNLAKQKDIISKICPWIADKFDGVQMFTSGLDSGHLGADVAIVLDVFLAHYVCKVSEVLGWLLSIKLLFKGKLSVSILGLYAGASSVVWFSQAGEINSLIVKAVNESFFNVLGGNFNENNSRKCAGFRKCLGLGLANSLVGSPAIKMPTWANSKGVKKMIDYVLVSSNLVNVIIHCGVSDAGEYFKIDHQAVSVSLGLGGLLDMQLNSLCKQANKDRWKFNFKSADNAKWNKFRDVVHKIIVFSADEVFKKKWFKDYDSVFTKESSKFHKLELLISKLVKASWLICHDEFISLLDVWGSLDNDNAPVVKFLFLSGSPLDTVWLALSKIRKTYRSLKMAESRSVEEIQIKLAIKKRMESFKLNKSYTIWSVLEHPFHKVVLDHLVVDDELILEPGPVKSRHRQYRPLDYIFDEAFSGVMQPIEFLELFGMVFDLPIGKAAGFSDISNKLWMHSDRSVLNMLLVLLNSCLSHESVSALIETACKILSKILSDRILLACSIHDILREDNFSVLKGTTTQTPIFAIGLVVEDALEKNRKLWLVLQDMQKVYNSVGWEHLKRCLVRIKICDKFICFFGNIHRNQTNRVMMDFGLTNGYSVHDGLAKEKFFPLFFGGFLTSSFRFCDGMPMSAVLGEFLFSKYLPSLWHYGIAFVDQLWDRHGNIFDWRSVAFLSGAPSSPLALNGVGPVDICGSDGFVSVGANSLSVYMDGSVKNLGTTGCKARAAAFFEDINLGLGVCVQGLMSSTLVELQAVVLALECVPVDCSVHLFLDSQAVLDACKSEVDLVCPDFCNWCWVEHWHIRNVIYRKNLKVSWHKIKSHSGVLENNCADSITDAVALSDWFLPPRVAERFLLAGGGIVSGNSRHFVRDVFRSVCWARWEVSSGSGFLAGDLHSDIDWLASSRVWHSDLHMATGFTSRCTANIHIYFIKALHRRLLVAVRKHVYNKCYSSVLCLYCGEVEVFDYVFFCVIDDAAHHRVLESCMSSWKVLSGLFLPASSILQLLSICALDFLVFSTFCKGFVFKRWLQKAVFIFHVPKVAGIKIADFVYSICVAFRSDIWLVHAKHCAYMERNGLILVDGSVPVSISDFTLRFSDGVVKLLGVAEAFGVHFGFHKSCSFFSGIDDPVSINIIV
ncbi:hypothetical protein G9A89_014729 [Geosiphon pyriformis]|nr:hypothetical protein G9A89_014729 [Geosiphon pyriformis]